MRITGVTLFKKIRFAISVSVLYGLTLLFVGYAVLVHPTPPSPVLAKAAPSAPVAPSITLIMGRPVRIVIPASNIDLPVDPGYYNEADGSWTLSDTDAQYAMMTVLANNSSGSTFIYGHGTDQVFNRLSTQPPTTGSEALVYTDNGYVFSYSFASSHDFTPDDTSMLSYSGPPILTVQTCSGSFSEWRTMYQFNFQKVVRV